MSNFTLSLTVLLTGFIVVFMVLLLLIGIIKLYGTIVYNAQNKAKKKKEKKVVEVPVSAPANVAKVESVEVFENSLSGEVIAVIAAAVDSMYGPGKVKIKGIRKTKSRKNAWRSAGIADNTSSFRGETWKF